MSVPFRADHVGSFLRPQELLSARERGAELSELAILEDRHILEVLKKQQDLGIEIFTDGELRRRNFMSNLAENVAGLELNRESPRHWNVSEAKSNVRDVTWMVKEKIHQRSPLTARELPFLKKHSPGAIKVLLPSANQFPAITFKRGITDKVYASHSELLWDIVEIVKSDIAVLATQGVDYIQLDAPRYSYFIDPKWREWVKREMGQEPDAALDEAIRADNRCFEAALESDAILGIHLCRGNNRSHWYAEGGYDAIAEKLFGTLEADRFLLEYDDERSGGFEPLRFVPKNRVVVLGLVSSKNPVLESSDEVMRRIDEAARYFPIENLTLSPQCGFASTMEGNLLTEEQQWAKLELVVDIARRVWG
jgi:5-methyltetrahydropteroyltriglutamate--homocysteine methyltransferase